MSPSAGGYPSHVLTQVPALLPDWLNAEYILAALGPYAFWGAVLIIFAECGLLIGFFLLL